MTESELTESDLTESDLTESDLTEFLLDRFFVVFLAVENSSVGDLVTHSLTDSLTQSLTDFYFCHTKSNPRDLRPLNHLIGVMRRHDLTEKDIPNSKNLKIF